MSFLGTTRASVGTRPHRTGWVRLGRHDSGAGPPPSHHDIRKAGDPERWPAGIRVIRGLASRLAWADAAENRRSAPGPRLGAAARRADALRPDGLRPGGAGLRPAPGG